MIVAICSGQPGTHARDIRAMAEALLHGEGAPSIWCDPDGCFAAASVGAGLLPEDRFDTQPYVDERYCFIADARLDNRADVAGALDISAAEAALMADAELMWRAWLRWGEACVERFSGRFAVCVWDRLERRLFAAADPLNSARTFKAERGETLLLASQMHALLAHPCMTGELDVEAVTLIVAPRMLPGRTPFRDVALLAGGYTFTWRAGKPTRVRRWWKLPAYGSIRYHDERDYVAHALELMGKAVAAHLRSPGDVSSAVSGGLDSTLVTALAAKELRQRGRTLASYTSVPSPGVPLKTRAGWIADESQYLKALSEIHPNIAHTLITPELPSALRLMPSIHARSHTPVRNTANLLWLDAMCRRVRAGGNRVLLMGEHGNVGLSLTGSVVLDTLFQRGEWANSLRLAQREAGLGGRPAWRVLAHELRYRVERALPRKPELRVGAFLYSEEAKAKLGDLLQQTPFEVRDVNTMRERATACAPAFSMHPGAQYGVEVRDPTSDRFFLEALLAFPIEAFYAGGRARGLAREMGLGIVPDNIRLRRSKGAQVPEHCGLIANDAAAYAEAIASLRDSPAARATMNLEAVDDLLRRLQAGDGNLLQAASLDRAVDLGLFLKGCGV